MKLAAGLLVGVVLGASGCASVPRPPAPAPVTPVSQVDTQIIGTRADGTPRELLARGENAELAQRWQEAVDALEALLAAEPDGELAPEATFHLASAYAGLGQREHARDLYHDLATRFPDSRYARTALDDASDLHAYLEEWQPLIDTANALLARRDLDDVDRITALGARGLGEIELGQLEPAAKDVEEGLELAETDHYGALNRLPVAAAQLRFALGEVRRARSERIALGPAERASTDPADFLQKIDARCALLLSAQNAYADAIRSVDPHWAAMSGYRVGEMYRTLHHELMSIPPVAAAKTERQKQLHFGMMHVRYRVLLEKGIEMMRRTLALAEKTGDTSSWVKRAEAAKAEMELAVAEEKTQIAALPFTEEELQAALDLLEKKTRARRPPER
jgi:tetratricopeptide (TPR) repeat protein